MLPNSSYRNIEKKHGQRGKYVLSRVFPWIGRLACIGGIAAMIYGTTFKNDPEKSARYIGFGTITALASGYFLDERRNLINLKRKFQEDKEKDEKFREDIINQQSGLEETLN